MDRTLPITIDESTWPGPGVPPLFPRSFKKGRSHYDLNIPSMLLMIGYLTTPAATTGVTLSEFWAWVRYLAAITPGDAEMKLTHSFAELDAHQKTILSDDFGMGVSMLWLTDKLDLDLIVDGRYFMQQYAASLLVTQRRIAKRGPNKTPDFVARDTRGRWHVIECKGTQSGVDYSERQLSGGIAQKHSLLFPKGHVGQRLVCGLTIGIEGAEGSRLKVIDPVPDEPFEILSQDLPNATDAATRGVMSKLLRMAGFEISAEAVASPSGKVLAWGGKETRAAEDKRHQLIKERDAIARAELSDADSHKRLFDEKFIGRETRIELPRAIRVGGDFVSHVIVRQGINRDAVSELAEQPTIVELIKNSEFDWPELIGQNRATSDGFSASLDIGKLFRAELIMRR